MSIEKDVLSINASLKEVGNNMRRFTEERQQEVAEIRADVQTMQQVMAKMTNEGVGSSFFAADSLGTKSIAALNEEHSFVSAAETARRGMKIGAFNSRINLDGSIRAALINDGHGTDTTTIPSQAERRGLIGQVQRPLRLLDVLPTRPTAADAVEYIQVTSTGDASEQVKEGDPKAQIDLDGVLKRSEISTLAGWTPASKQVLSDHAALAAQIDRVIRYKVLARLETQLINGLGGAGTIDGLLHQSTVFTPTIATRRADIVGESLMVQADAGYQPNLVLLNPIDWFKLQITTKNADDYEYVFGSPTVPVPPALWNTAIVTTPSMPVGTGMSIDTSYTTVLDREQVSVAVSNSHADYFVRNLVAILAELRAGLEVTDTGAVASFALPD